MSTRNLARQAALRSLAITFALVTVATPASGSGGERFNGTFEAEPVRAPECTSPVSICTRGLLYDASSRRLVASYEFTMTSMLPTGDGSEFAFTGTSFMKKLGGAPGTIRAEDEGTIRAEPDGSWPFVTRVHVVGGTDSYDGASGFLTAKGELESSSGATSGTYEGTISH